MTNHDDVLDRIDAVIRDAEIDEIVDWQLARGGHDGPGVPPARALPMVRWMWGGDPPSLAAWLIDQIREAELVVQRLRKRGRL
ncbi:hypothetical protein [Gordonia hongkongensis]|uniref:hypothetical protein n=1 Tax=Gordonia hongkongensis TaxID=1701090 RepID=UPI003D76567C